MRMRYWSIVLVVTGFTGTVQGQERMVFATSTWGNADLGNWPDAIEAGAVGLAAADAICQAKASAGGLAEPHRFVAWLSDRDDDAYCRLLDLDGKREEQCGGALTSSAAGPWIRTDGVPFAESLDALVDGKVLSPVMYDELGNRLEFKYESFTATAADGTFNDLDGDASDCEHWSSSVFAPFSNAYAGVGSNTGTTETWTQIPESAVTCNGTRRLLCMQRGVGEPLPPRSLQGRLRAFVTDASFDGDFGVDGNFGGAAVADEICRLAASEAHIPASSSFRALLTSVGEFASIAERFDSKGPWYRLDGMLFAASMDEITAGEVTVPLNVTETGKYVGHDAYAYTGANGDGTASGNDCGEWNLAGGIASASFVNEVFFAPSGGHNWLSTSQISCAAGEEVSRRLYCLSDISLVFSDGFEP